jgi:NitT/TauT family transport system ATP-binding protein
MAVTETLSETAIAEPILTVHDVTRGFPRGSGEIHVLADVDLVLRAGEIVGLLGRSGSGKSTLLRIIAGLIRPSSGEVIYRGRPVNGPPEGIAMVFQTFALFPWLTVLQNVEAGLEALSVPAKESRRRALSAIDHRPRRFRIGLPARIVGRHASARRLCPRPRGRADNSVAG